MLKIAEYTKKVNDLKKKVIEALDDAGLEIHLDGSNSNTIRIVFAGQYSAGKSSIMKMITGRKDIDIGAGITTQEAHTYKWNGMEIIDTPGIHTELRPDHDEITYRAIAKADMLVFVITNELFDSYLATHFRKLAIEHDKAGEMVLVVNKMERASDGNSPQQQTIIREDLQKVLTPYTPEQLNLCFLDAESYLESVEERESDPELADELFARSGYEDFITTLNQFVESKSIFSKITTELYVLEDSLEKAVHELEPKSMDIDVNALEENYYQQRNLLCTSRNQIKQEVKDIFTSATSEIRNLGLEAANLLVAGCTQEEVEKELENSVKKVNEIAEKCQEEAINLIEIRLTEMGKVMDQIENSEFSKQLKIRLLGKFDTLPQNIQALLTNAGSGLQNAGSTVTNTAYKAGVQSGLRLSNFSGSTVHQIVLKAGHSIGYKFQPWQAIKITKGIAIGGKILGILGVGLSVFMQIKSDADADRIRDILKKNRNNIRSQFNVVANELEDFGKVFIQKNIVNPLEEPISEIDRKIREIRKSRNDRNKICLKMETLQNECQNLIREIHAL